ncbi:MAG: alcohol dehydrogenase catalytic domain-containing protein, partial [Stenotrophomonas acidaminiphila]|nr:alcohol dehydrogenase catalytic domain-containing protein [Stenotrophomonas acidaminiphila]
MKAVRLHVFGGPEVLTYEDAPRPDIGSVDVLVRVHAVGINPPDLYLRDGYRALPPEWRPQPNFPLIIGTDISGVVEAIGDEAILFASGDEVSIAGDVTRPGCNAQYQWVDERLVARKPTTLDFAEAAALPLTTIGSFPQTPE